MASKSLQPRAAQAVACLFALVAACSTDRSRATPPLDQQADPGTASGEDAGISEPDDARAPDAAMPPVQRDAAIADGVMDGSVDAAMNAVDAAVNAVDAAITDAAMHAVDAGPRFPPVSDFAMPGPFKTVSEPGGGACTVFRPETLGEGGLHHPVIVWGNGTYTPTVLVYAGFFRHWASHGFIVAAAHTSNAGTGVEMLACLDWVEAEHARAGSPYEGHVDLDNAGATGHSQGGGGALMAGRDARIHATVPIMAYILGLGHDSASQMQQHGPMLLVSGGQDTVAPRGQNQQPVFDASNVPTFWSTFSAGDHVSIALGAVQPYLGPSTAWFRLHLMGDESALSLFHGEACGLCTNADWVVERKGIH